MQRGCNLCKVLDEPAVVRGQTQETSYIGHIGRVRLLLSCLDQSSHHLLRSRGQEKGLSVATGNTLRVSASALPGGIARKLLVTVPGVPQSLYQTQ